MRVRRRQLGALASALVWLAGALLVWLDSSSSPIALRPSVPLEHAAIFGAILAAIQVIGSWLGTAAAATASYLATAVAWLGGRLGTFIKATGVVFAKSWDALKIVYSDVVKPALAWLDEHIKRLYSWLQQTFKPVFDVLKRIRSELLDAYARYVRPFLAAIDAIRAGLRVLGDLGVGWAKQLDARLGEFESLITRNFQRVLGELNKIIDVLASILTLDGLLQRFVFIRTLQRDVTYAWRSLVNIGVRPLSDFEHATLVRAGVTQKPAALTSAVAEYLSGTPNDVGAAIDAAVESSKTYLENWDAGA